MTTIGITGHRLLTPESAVLIAAGIIEELAACRPPLVGLTSLAVGADQIFAHAVLAAGGEVTFIQPCDDIASTFSREESAHFQALRCMASETVSMPFTAPIEDAYLAAGRYIADHSDELLAVWDGKAAVGSGGTADIVAYRRSLNGEARIIWPAGVRRA